MKNSQFPDIMLNFVKMHGAGNDFVVFDGLNGAEVDLQKIAPAICDRHFGIGADGVIEVLDSSTADLGMRYLNADGSEAICSNGMRCIANYALGKRVPVDAEYFTLDTLGGEVNIVVDPESRKVSVEMPEPVFDGKLIPTNSLGEHLDFPLEVGDTTFMISAVGMGNPHCVVFVDDVDAVPLSVIGPKLENHPFFPERTNVEFVQVMSPELVLERTWERGVGETLACGSGSCAVIAAGVRTGRLDRQVRLLVRGGQIDASWPESTKRILISGPVSEVFSGRVSLASLQGL